MGKKNIIDLFSGAGGFSFGFQKAGFHIVMAIDNWKDAIDTFNENHKGGVGVCKDIYDFTDEEIASFGKKNKIVGIIGGPPCQGFSMVGTRNFEDERNTLYLQYVRFVELIKPEFFILENVRGLLTLKNGYFKRDIISRFSDLGYNMNYSLLKASDFGVPQSRERVFFVGLRKEIFDNKFFNFPVGNKEFISTEDAIGDLPSLDKGESKSEYNKKPLNQYQRMMREGSTSITNNDITHHTIQTKKIISLIPDGGNIKCLSEKFYKVRNYNTAFKRMDSNKPSTTIDCGHRNYFHYRENRIPTVRESARIQSFPDVFHFLGSKTSQYKQVGNAVPPLLAQVMGEAISKMYSELKT